ncbi:MAG: pseudouridine synthase, RluA family, partial [Caulobacteraceae bacterium]|nr:pseudouridine synthase, RluA family [Caulobacteraceae bacterium]
MREVRTLTVEAAEEGVRLDRWFKRRWPHLNHIQLNKLFRSGQVRVDGARAKGDLKLVTGASVRVPPLPDAPDPGERRDISPRDVAFVKAMVLYEDRDVLVLNKPAGLAVQGGTKTTHHIDRLLSAWGDGESRPRLVHRLDRDTSGVLILGRSAAAAAALSGAFARRRAHKTYWALVAGAPKPAKGLIELALVKKGINDREMIVPAERGDPDADQASTAYVTLSRTGQRISWMALRPLTGRTHQLRAHMKAIGHSILGDPKYNDPASQALSEGLALQLHARRLDIPHPNGRRLVI